MAEHSTGSEHGASTSPGDDGQDGKYYSHRFGVPEGAPDTFDPMEYAIAHDSARSKSESVAQDVSLDAASKPGSYDVLDDYRPEDTPVESAQVEHGELGEQESRDTYSLEHDILFPDIPMSPETRENIDIVLSHVVGLGAFGKFPPGTRVHTERGSGSPSIEMSVGQGRGADFKDFGSTPFYKELMNGLSQDAGLGSHVNTIRNYYKIKLEQPMPHVIMRISFPENAPARAKAESAVVYMYEAVGLHGERNIGQQAIAAFMSDDASEALIRIIPQDPGSAEYFFRTAFNGLDRQTLPSPENQDPSKGIERSQCDEVLLVQGSPLAEQGFFGELLAPPIDYSTLYYTEQYGDDPSQWPERGGFMPTAFKDAKFYEGFENTRQLLVPYPKPFGTGVRR
jgi:hypothetical protein